MALLNLSVDFRSRLSLSAGRQVSLLVALLLRGLTLAADPAGVEALRSNQQMLKNQQCTLTQIKVRMISVHLPSI